MSRFAAPLKESHMFSAILLISKGMLPGTSSTHFDSSDNVILHASAREIPLISGALAGIFIYFKAGVTMGNNPDPYNKERKNKMKKLKKSR